MRTGRAILLVEPARHPDNGEDAPETLAGMTELPS